MESVKTMNAAYDAASSKGFDFDVNQLVDKMGSLLAESIQNVFENGGQELIDRYMDDKKKFVTELFDDVRERIVSKTIELADDWIQRREVFKPFAQEYVEQVDPDYELPEIDALYNKFTRVLGEDAHVQNPAPGRYNVPLFTSEGNVKNFKELMVESPQVEYSMEKENEGLFAIINKKAPLQNMLPVKETLSADSIILVKDIPSALALSAASGRAVLATFSDKNMERVAELLHEKHPNARIVMAKDLDHDYSRFVSDNPSKARILRPSFTAKEKGQGLKTFRDLGNSRGISTVTRQMGSLVKNHAVEKSKGNER